MKRCIKYLYVKKNTKSSILTNKIMLAKKKKKTRANYMHKIYMKRAAAPVPRLSWATNFIPR
jgi:hypothetical protein